MATARQQSKDRFPLLLAIALPVLAGIAYMHAYGAPQSYILVNSGALLVAALWIFLRPPLSSRRTMHIAGGLVVVLFVLPLLTGPEVNGVARWIPVGPFQFHSGAIAVPLLAGVAATDRDDAPIGLLGAIFLAILQPDGGTLFAITGLAIGLYFAKPDWKPGAVAAAAFFAALHAHFRGMLAPQPFVERVLADLLLSHPLLALGLFASLVASFWLILRAWRQPFPVRAALAGAMAGFTLAAIMSNYPSILIGYGASPIIGFGLALGIRWRPS